MKQSIEQLAADCDFLKVQRTFHNSQCAKYQKALNATVTGLLCFTYIGEGDQTDKIILEEPKADSAREIQTYVRQLANNMADFHHSKVLLLTEQIDQLAEQIHSLHLSATQQGKGGNVGSDITSQGNG